MIKGLSVVLLSFAVLVFLSGASLAQPTKTEDPKKTEHPAGEKKKEDPSAEKEKKKSEHPKAEEKKPEHPKAGEKKSEHPK
jgi:hypothetical protein